MLSLDKIIINELNHRNFSGKKTCRFVHEQANLNLGMAGMLERIMTNVAIEVKRNLHFAKEIMRRTPLRQFCL